MAIDYADQNYFASTSLDKPGLVIWDKRATSRSSSSNFYLDTVDTDNLPWGAALNIERAIDVKDANLQDRGSLTRSVRFCRDRSGLIAVLSRTGQLKVLDIKKEFVPSTVYPKDSPEVLEVRKSYELDMSYMRDRKDERIVSFDWLNLDSPALTPRAIVLRANGNFDILEKPSYTSEHLFKMIPWKAPHRGLEGKLSHKTSTKTMSANESKGGHTYHSLMQFESAQYSDMLGSLNIDRAFEDMPLFGIDKGSAHAAVQEALLSPMPTSDPIYDSEASDTQIAELLTNASKTADKLRVLRKFHKENLKSSKNDDKVVLIFLSYLVLRNSYNLTNLYLKAQQATIQQRIA